MSRAVNQTWHRFPVAIEHPMATGFNLVDGVPANTMLRPASLVAALVMVEEPEPDDYVIFLTTVGGRDLDVPRSVGQGACVG